MRKLFCGALGMAATMSAAVLAQTTASQIPVPPATPMFRAGVDLVTVSVIVRGRNGTPVEGLSEQDFELYDAGHPTPIKEFRADPSPARVAIVVDASGSMAIAPKAETSRDAASQVVRALQVGADSVGLYDFDTSLHEIVPFTLDLDEAVAGLDRVRPFGETSLYDAIAGASHALAAQPVSRRAVVVVTDGGDNASRQSATAVSEAASALDVPVYAIEIVPPLDRERDATTAASGDDAGRVASDAALAQLVEETGGRLLRVTSAEERAAAAASIVTELRQQYLLAFAPSRPAGWHSLDVRIKRKNLVVRARRGYMAGTRDGE